MRLACLDVIGVLVEYPRDLLDLDPEGLVRGPDDLKVFELEDAVGVHFGGGRPEE